MYCIYVLCVLRKTFRIFINTAMRHDYRDYIDVIWGQNVYRSNKKFIANIEDVPD